MFGDYHRQVAWSRRDDEVDRTTNNKLQVEMEFPVRIEQGGQSYADLVAVVRGPQVLAMEVGGKEPTDPVAQTSWIGI